MKMRHNVFTNLDEKINTHSTNIDVLRFLAAVSVIFSHSYPLTQNRTDILGRISEKNNLGFGGLAVAIFFFISGLYVTKSLEKSDSIVKFMIKRVKRIFPQMIVLTLCTAFILGPIVTTLTIKKYFSDPQTYRYLLNAVLIPIHDLPGVFVDNPYLSTVNGALWTMPLEFACYIVLALAAWLSKKIKKNRKVLDIALFVIISIGCIASFYIMKSTTIMSISRPVVCFFAGVLFFDFKERIPLNPIIGITCVALMLLLLPSRIFLIIFIALFPYAIASVTLGLPQIRHLPDICSASYEMYLVGFPIQQTLVYVFRNMTPVMNFVSAVFIDMILGYIFYDVMRHCLKHL